jgi:hypothetical protein
MGTRKGGLRLRRMWKDRPCVLLRCFGEDVARRPKGYMLNRFSLKEYFKLRKNRLECLECVIYTYLSLILVFLYT